MICRIWHGWTTAEHADEYEELLRAEIVSAITERAIDGYLGMQVLRRDATPDRGTETEFITIMRFESLESIVAFAGDEPTLAMVPAAAQALLSRFDRFSAHYEVRVTA